MFFITASYVQDIVSYYDISRQLKTNVRRSVRDANWSARGEGVFDQPSTLRGPGGLETRNLKGFPLNAIDAQHPYSVAAGSPGKPIVHPQVDECCAR